ncbi:MAG TPA: hypothetical protein ENL20_03810 [Candidatus Cloacimonetes bacterium]|nr:hypothetical protein [Candidatus Cloacimonadota bacterium]
MSPSRFEDLLDVVLEDKPSKAKLKRLGMTEEELKLFIDAILEEKEPETYNRVLSADEKKVLSTEAFGYLMHLLKINSIDRFMFEKIISLSMQLNSFMKRKLTKNMMDDIVNFIIFSGQGDVFINERMDIYCLLDSEVRRQRQMN